MSEAVKNKQKACLETIRHHFKGIETDIQCLQNYLLDDFKLVETLCQAASLERGKEDDLVEILATFFESVNKQQDLMEWSVRHEVSSTDSQDQLFRMGSFATSLIYRYLFNDIGVTYLITIIQPLIDSLLDLSPNELEINLNGNNKPQNVEKNLNTLLFIAESFLTRLYNNVALVPLNVRFGLTLMKKEVYKKYPQMTNVIPSMLFLRFLSPTILQPQSYCVTNKELDPSLMHLLLALTKLFQSIANGIPKANITNLLTMETSIIHFINKHVKKLEKFCKSLTDDFDTACLGESETKRISQSRKLAALKQISQYICYEFFPNETKYRMIAKESSSDASEKVRLSKMEKIVNRLEDINRNAVWFPIREERYISIHKVKREQVYIYKLEVLLKGATMEDTYESIKKIHTQFDDDRNVIQGRRIELHSTDHLDLYFKFNFPFPFSHRDFVCKGVGRLVSRDEAQFFLVAHKRSDSPKEKGIVRGVLEAGYFLVREDNAIKVISILIMDAKGNLPRWGAEKPIINFLTTFLNDRRIRNTPQKTKSKSPIRGVSVKEFSPKKNKKSKHEKIEQNNLTKKVFNFDEDEELDPNEIMPIVIRGRMVKATSTTAITRVTFAEEPLIEQSMVYNTNDSISRSKSFGSSKKKSRASRSASPSKTKKKELKSSSN